MTDNEKWQRTSPEFNTTREAYEWLTPTDAEREALIDVMRNAPTHGNVVVRYDEAADAILAAGFRRTEVPEPSVEHTSFYGTPGTHPGTRQECKVCPPEPQGEPSDAQVEAEAGRRWPHTGNGGDLDHNRAVRRLSFRQGAEWMRAALRAAQEAR